MTCPPPPPTIAEAAAAIRDRSLDPVELTEQILQRIEALEPHIHAYHLVMRDEARAAASAAEAEIAGGHWRGPLHGIPIAIKDVFYMKGHKTTSNSRVMLDWEADDDATVISRLRDAGAVIMGQLNTYEFTFGGRPTFDAPFPPARNPWDLERMTGGSSSGSGAAVAAGLCLGAIGSDAGGSIRTPAAMCGIAGLKPTIGRIGAYGDMPLTYSFDCVGPMAWTAEDCALMLQAIAGHDPRDPMSVDTPVDDYSAALGDSISGLRVGMIRHFYSDDWDTPDEITRAIDGVGETLAALGANVEEVTLSPLLDWHAVGRILIPAEAYAIHEDRLRDQWDEYGPLARSRMMLGGLIRAVDYIQAQRRRTELMAEMDALFETFDILVTTATLSATAPINDTNPFPGLETPMIQVPFNLTLHPAIAVRAGFGEDGMPIGAQIAGRHWDEATVLRTAHAFEQKAGILNQRPPDDFA